MASTKLPDPIRRRHLLEGDLGQAEALALAEAYLVEDRAHESIAFFAKAGAREKLELLRDRAVEEGDAFLMREVQLALKEEPGAERWRRLGEAARAAGKELYAADADRQALRGVDS